MLLGAVAGSSILAIGATRAIALSSEPMAPADIQALALACGKPASHAQLIADARLILNAEIESGAKPADTTELVACPLCRCTFEVASDIRF
ncbi:hypothetical protein [Dongia sp.]|uniref:hypothetical protein n=1 Tax=Dongia sp. TaxID=1977262 RepID=UPI0035B0FD84